MPEGSNLQPRLLPRPEVFAMVAGDFLSLMKSEQQNLFQ